jgi:predicted Zn-dependent protease
MNDQSHIEAASGYLYLGLSDECLEELQHVEFSQRRNERFMVLRLSALIAQSRWADAFVASRMLKARYPECEMAYTSGAICLMEMSRYQEAMELILEGPLPLREEAIFHIQLAYCQLHMGNEHAAYLSLNHAREIDPKWVNEVLPLIAEMNHATTAGIFSCN